MTLPETVKILAIGLVYFLIIYLIAIRREVRPVLPWLAAIGTQVLSVLCFRKLLHFVSRYLTPSRYGSLGLILVSLSLLVVNIGVILLVFGGFFRPRRTNEESQNEEVPAGAYVPAFTESEVGEPIPLSTAGESPDELMDSIDSLIADGKKEEAVQYLKMIVLCGKNDQTRRKASEMILTLQEA